MSSNEELGLLKRVANLSYRFSSLEAKVGALLRMEIPKSPLLFCRPLGHIRTAYTSKTGTPRQGAVCPQLRAELRISRDIFSNPSHSLIGLHEFSHVWLIFWFHLNEDKRAKAKVRPPRLNGTPTGVFSTRSPHRPNPIGLTLAHLEQVDGDTLVLTGVDLVDGTPILDIKPFIPSYDTPSKVDADSASDNTWVTRVDQTKPVRSVVFTADAYDSVKHFHKRCGPTMCSHCLEFIDEQALLPAIHNLLKSDLRSVYRKAKCSDRIHFLSVDRVKLSVWYDPDGSAHILHLTCKTGEADEQNV